MKPGDNFFDLGKCEGFSFEASPNDTGQAAKMAAAYNSAMKATNVTISGTFHELDEWAWIIVTYPRRYG